MNRFRHFTPLMHEAEYKFIENSLCPDDVLLEWGSGNSTIYFSGIVKKVISIEHDIDWINIIKKVICGYDISNIDIHHVPAHSPDPVPCRYEQFKEYIHYPTKHNFFFTKVLIDGRARKYCAKYLYDNIKSDIDIFIHDFNRPDYQKTLKYFDLQDVITSGQGIARLRKKSTFTTDDNYY